MTDPADITDDPRELAERLRRVAPDAPSHLQGKLYEAADALARLAPEPRQWQPGDWAWGGMNYWYVRDVRPEGCLIDAWNGQTNAGGWVNDVRVENIDGWERCDPPPSWVEAGRPGAPQPEPVPSGLYRCTAHRGVHASPVEFCDFAPSESDGPCRWVELLQPAEVESSDETLNPVEDSPDPDQPSSGHPTRPRGGRSDHDR